MAYMIMAYIVMARLSAQNDCVKVTDFSMMLQSCANPLSKSWAEHFLHLFLYLCIDMRIDMCIGMRIDMHIDMCLDMRMDMCIDVCVNMPLDMCLDMCLDMRILSWAYYTWQR